MKDLQNITVKSGSLEEKKLGIVSNFCTVFNAYNVLIINAIHKHGDRAENEVDIFLRSKMFSLNSATAGFHFMRWAYVSMP